MTSSNADPALGSSMSHPGMKNGRDYLVNYLQSFNSRIDFLLITDRDVLGSIIVQHLLDMQAGHVVGEQAGIVLWVISAKLCPAKHKIWNQISSETNLSI